MSEERILTTDDVTIKTLAIEVKVMKIGNRQVTLAVFRQLPEEPIISPYGVLSGIPWGRVNYHVDCESLAYKHLHIVWQDGNKLKRAIALNWLVRSALQGGPYSFHGRKDFEETTRRLWEQSYAKLEALDQLFIAV